MAKFFRTSRLFFKAGWLNISSSMAGAIITGHVDDKYTDNNILSQIPCAILAKVLQEAGAMSIISAQRPNITWLLHSRSVDHSMTTLFFDKVLKTKGDTNVVAVGVMTTFTSAPALMKSLTNKGIL